MKQLNLILLAVFLALVVVSFSYNIYSSPITGNVIQNYASIDDALNHSNEIVNEYNKNINKVPLFVRKLFGNEVLNITLIRLNNTKNFFCIVTKNSKVESLEKHYCTSHSPTMNVWITEQSINDIIESDDQLSRFEDAVKRKEIDYKAISFKTKVKMAISRIGLKIFGFFR